MGWHGLVVVDVFVGVDVDVPVVGVVVSLMFQLICVACLDAHVVVVGALIVLVLLKLIV